MKRNNARTHVFGIGACMSALLIAGCLAGCTPENAGQTQQASNEGAAGSSTQSAQASQATALEHIEAHETLQTHTVKSADLAQKIYDAYLKGEVGNTVDMISSDYDDTLVFTLDDGSTLTVEFNAHNLRDGDTYRAFDDKGGLWKLLAEMSD